MTVALVLSDRLAAAIGDGVLRVLGVARTAVVTVFRERLAVLFADVWREPRPSVHVPPVEGGWVVEREG